MITSAEVISARVRQLRARRGWSAAQLADALTEAGMPLQRAAVAKLENGYRTTITVDELLTLAYVLDVSPINLMLPVEPSAPGEAEVAYQVTPVRPCNAQEVRAWIRGLSALPGQNERTYLAERPIEELR